jgi:hypothetical protein
VSFGRGESISSLSRSRCVVVNGEIDCFEMSMAMPAEGDHVVTAEEMPIMGSA